MRTLAVEHERMVYIRDRQIKWNTVVQALAQLYKCYWGRDMPFDDTLDELMVAYNAWLDNPAKDHDGPNPTA